MSRMQPRQSVPPGTPRAKGKNTIFLVWAGVGLVFALLQFGYSETLLQTAESGGPEWLYDVSNLMVWPAGLIYDGVQKQKLTGLLEAFAAGEENDPALREQARSLLPLNDDTMYSEEVWEIVDHANLPGDIDQVTEYFIYGGVCAGYGVLIAVLGSLFTLFWQKTN